MSSQDCPEDFFSEARLSDVFVTSKQVTNNPATDPSSSVKGLKLYVHCERQQAHFSTANEKKSLEINSSNASSDLHKHNPTVQTAE